ncbi:sacsin N-terminal ATP-binding-like domain-containing protein [Pedobacter sp. SL55]|uniref:sacsin N-terminal ATP-binding-like domain-containing protein n=1 Tax=Pedobacter sp. SL55 TaxID=2995161 RepID=UPI00226D9B36|nr:hypothetical protein [Pedobacter sp. SL55]WAC39432.1 hypothetical protein OVA16_12565 [Pedobacter sp. SL55]
MITKLQVEDIIEKRWTSLKDPKELISLYSIEKQTNQGYNGRQLLELFQNCEDEGASIVEISLDTETCSLTISNDGPKPFSLKGYDSIFYPGLSSKVSSGYIGNKGLGFRSIINWADQITIISNDFKVVFDNSFDRRNDGIILLLRQPLFFASCKIKEQLGFSQQQRVGCFVDHPCLGRP